MNACCGALKRLTLRTTPSLHQQSPLCSAQRHIARRFHNATPDERPFRLAVIGSGPAGFYSAHRIMQRIPNGIVDMYEQLPVPFGLVRFGVAPDHPEVKNCEDKFREIAESPRFNFIGNVGIGHEVSLTQLRDQYDSVLFAYGASKDRELEIPGEHLSGIYSARAFVGWYNGLPEYFDLSPNLKAGDTAVVIGQGNVALDVARVLLSGVDRLKNTDISDRALQQLSESTIKEVRVVGRRGPLQASFTIKEVRELTQLPGAKLEPIDESLLPGVDVKLPRAPKRITELFRKYALSSTREGKWDGKPGTIGLDFLRAPVAFINRQYSNPQVSSVLFNRTTFAEGQDPSSPGARVVNTGHQFDMEASAVFRSIGYKAEPLPGMADLGIKFDTRTGIIPNLAGRVLRGDQHIPGLYCAGWVKRGPTGVIATTMEDGFATAELIAEDWQGGRSIKPGWEALKSRVPNATDWQDWLKIDAAEKERGRTVGKEREKFKSVQEMLDFVR